MKRHRAISHFEVKGHNRGQVKDQASGAQMQPHVFTYTIFSLCFFYNLQPTESQVALKQICFFSFLLLIDINLHYSVLACSCRALYDISYDLVFW